MKEPAAKRMKKVRDVHEAIDALGGAVHVARSLGLEPGAVRMWLCRKAVGRGHHLHVFLSLRRLGFDPAPAVFGIERWEQVVIPKRRRRLSARGALANHVM